MAWVDKATAASALHVSARTLERRIADGKVQTRKDESRVLVMVEDPSTPADTDVPGSEGMIEILRRIEQAQTAANAKEMDNLTAALAASQKLSDQAERQVRRARRDAHVAAAVIFVLLLAGALGLWHMAGQVATARAAASQLQATRDELSKARAALVAPEQALRELEFLRQRIEKAWVASGGMPP